MFHLPTKKPIVYPDCDGQPMAENTLQYQWLVTIKDNLESIFDKNPDVFVAGDLLWYPVEGQPKISVAPDVMVAFGRPKGYRGSYKQWEEDGIAPHVVFEILSPGNRPTEMTRKFKFYEQHGVEEYYIHDPDANEVTGWLRVNGVLSEIADMRGWVSPRLGVRFEPEPDGLLLRRPNGTVFKAYREVEERSNDLEREKEQIAQELQLSNWERDKALAQSAKLSSERDQAFEAKAEAERIAKQQAEEIARLKAQLQSRD